MRPNTPVRGKSPGVAAIDVDGDRYCLSCAPDVISSRDEITVQYNDDSQETIQDPDGEEIVDGLVSGDIYTLGMGGVVLSSDESTLMHCGRHSSCVNALSGDEHDYDHDSPVGGRLDLKELPEGV